MDINRATSVRGEIAARPWSARLAKYRQRSNWRAAFEIMVTAGPFAGLWATAWLATSVSYWLAILVSLLAAFFLVRLFMIQHDCGHGALFRRRSANDWIGRAIGVLTLTPYDCWRRDHNQHHAGSGNLDRRGIGDVTTLTVNEYTSSTAWARFKYRLYRHPLVMFGIGPTFLFVVKHRVPGKSERHNLFAWVTTIATNLATLCVIGGLIAAVGFIPFLAVQIPLTILGATIGVWLFYVQHQFEVTYWAKPQQWTSEAAALYGSSYLVLPEPLNWLTANIGLHHVHHLSSGIPFYRLQRVLKDWPELRNARCLTITESVRSLKLALWDEASQRLVAFKHSEGHSSATG
ncbi:MAG TPA: fatty acid desaturase [Gammaproteobacteria bacterium]|nr:fatty acid desaturase [Gammaproteobacteria bacterium]